MTRSFTRQALAATALIFALQPLNALAADATDGVPQDDGYHTNTVSADNQIIRAFPVRFTPAQQVRPAQSNSGMVPIAGEPDPTDLHW